MEEKILKTLKTNGSISLEEVNKVEKELNVKFPQDYVDFMLKYNGGVGTFDSGHIVIWKIEDIVKTNFDYKVEEFFSNLVYFGSDGSGAAYAFDKEDDMVIIKVPFITNNVEEEKEIIGTFEELLESLVKPNLLDVLRKDSNIEIKQSSKQDSMRDNDEYIIPDGGDIMIYLNYECCKNKITDGGISAFFVKKLNLSDNVIIFDKPHIRISTNGINHRISDESFKKIDESFKLEYINSLKEDGESKQVIEMFENCDSEYFFDATSAHDAFIIYCFALYLSNFEGANVLLCDTYSGNILTKEKIEKAVFDYKNNLSNNLKPEVNSKKQEKNNLSTKKSLKKILLYGILLEVFVFVMLGFCNNESLTTFLALLFFLILIGEFMTFIYYLCLKLRN